MRICECTCPIVQEGERERKREGTREGVAQFPRRRARRLPVDGSIYHGL